MRVRLTSLVLLIGLVTAACTTNGEEANGDTAPSESGGAEGPSGTLVIGNFQPFSGPNALFGPWMIGSCWAAVDLINAEGGVLGNDVSCGRFDSFDNPAQAIPAAQQMIAATPGLVGILGPSSDTAQATVPVINEAQIPFFPVTGLVDFNQNDFEYFWRIAPVDDGKGIAMSIVARDQGFQRAAIVATDDPGSQSIVPQLERVFEELGGEVVISVRLAAEQSSYRTEAQEVLDANPDVILTESDYRSAATFFGQMGELTDSQLPVIGTEKVHEPPYVKAVSAAIGDEEFRARFVSVAPYTEMSGSAYDAFAESALSSTNVADAAAEGDLDGEFLSTDPYAIGWYDSTNILALAMIAAGTTDPATYNSSIIPVTAPEEGKVEVGTFAEGKEALENGDSIQYVGVAGPYIFNQYHNSSPPYAAKQFVAPGEVEVIQVVTVEQLAEVME